MSDTLIVPIGPDCFCRYIGLSEGNYHLLSNPLDNCRNRSLFQYRNILTLIKTGFSILTKKNAVPIETPGNGKDVYHGYKFVKTDLVDLYLPHFLDATDNEEDAWDRFHHKVKNLMDALADPDQDLLFVSIRNNNYGLFETEHQLQVLENDAKNLVDHIYVTYGRSPANFRMLHFVKRDIPERFQMHKSSGGLTQFYISVDAEDKKLANYYHPYRKRDAPLYKKLVDDYLKLYFS